MDKHYFVDTPWPDHVPLSEGCSITRTYQPIPPITLKITDDNTQILIAGKDELPRAVSSLLLSRGATAASLAIFVIHAKNQTVVLPCAEILRTCYIPSAKHLADFLTKDANAYEDGTVIFNGYRYVDCSKYYRVYPFLAEKNGASAAYELHQLVPRAVAYARSGSGEMPIIIRPPFRGLVKVHGLGIQLCDK